MNKNIHASLVENHEVNHGVIHGAPWTTCMGDVCHGIVHDIVYEPEVVGMDQTIGRFFSWVAPSRLPRSTMCLPHGRRWVDPYGRSRGLSSPRYSGAVTSACHYVQQLSTW